MAIVDWIGDIFGIAAPSALEIVFICCAVFGAGFFMIMMALMLVGDMLGGVVDTAFDTDFSMDTDLSFELFSLQGISAAIMMFGLAGMFGLSATNNDFIAVVSGGFAAYASLHGVKIMMQGIHSLQADGTMDLRSAIGEKGEVYSRIRPNATGEVNVPVEGTLRTLAARAKDDALLIGTGEFIAVVDVIGSTLIVEKIGSLSTEEE